MVVDYDKILTKNPAKHLRVSYEKMKSNYNESAATEYKALYENMPLSFLLENSRYIFAEPRLGYQFYLENVLNNQNAIMIAEYATERNKVEDFIQEFGNSMGSVQKKMYDDLYELLNERVNSVHNINTILEHAFSKDENAKEEYKTITESVYSQDADKIIHAFENAHNKDVYYSLLPFASSSIDPSKFLNESVIDEDTNRANMDAWKTYVESIVIISKLFQDKVYVEAVNRLPFYGKMFLNGFATESLSKQLDELTVVHVVESADDIDTFNKKSFNCFYSTPQNAVNRIFQDDEIYQYEKAENEEFKQERAMMDEIAKDVLLEYVTSEYYNSDNTDALIKGYNYFNDDISLESAFMILSEDASGNPNKVVAAHSTSMRETEKPKKSSNDRNTNIDNDDDEDGNDEEEDDDSNKSTPQQNYQPKAPKPKNVANAVQFKAMDAEAKQMKRLSNVRKVAGDVKNAAKAVAALPTNVLNSIKDVAKQWDEADEDRRKKYMIEPGFRKRSLKNLKLAILYGGAAQANLALVPVVAIIRHYSKDKDRRIRNELAHELDTEIKVTEEKISDASANGDQQQKYKLMRIKASLEREALRVKTNSKYV